MALKTRHTSALLIYEVEIIDEPVFRDGTEYPKTARVSFFNELGKKMEIIDYAYCEVAEVYKKLEEGENITLNYCYVKDFSLTAYRDGKGFNEDMKIQLKKFSAKKSFFDCDATVDFSYGEFYGKRISFEGTIFGNGTVNFTGATFEEGDANFKKTRFGDGKIVFQYAEFKTNSVSFGGTDFGNGDLSFVNCDFGNGNVDFKQTNFGDGGVDFKFAKFGGGDLSFERSVFGPGNKDFKTVEFGGGRIDFRRVVFNDGDVNFEGCEFGEGKVNFKLANFGDGDINFSVCDFSKSDFNMEDVHFGGGHLYFNHTKASKVSFRGSALDLYIDLRFEKADYLDLSDTIVRDILDMMPQSDNPVDIKCINFNGMRILGRIFISWDFNNVQTAIHNQKEETSLIQKAEQFRMLKENFRNNGQYDDEDLAYIEFKRLQARSELERAIKKGKKEAVAGYANYYFQKYLFDYVGRYGTAPLRVLANMVITFCTFSIFYFVITDYFPDFGTVATTLPDELNHKYGLWNCFYYSAITFFTIGYGDYFAEGYLKPFAAFEGFSGVFLMSYFTVAFVRKILR